MPAGSVLARFYTSKPLVVAIRVKVVYTDSSKIIIVGVWGVYLMQRSTMALTY